MDQTSSTDEPNSPHRRIRHSLEFKLRVVAESFAPGASISRIAREHGLNSNLLFNWRYQYRKGLLTSVADTPVMLPVTVSDFSAAPSVSHHLDLTLAKGQIRIQGRPDPETLRLVLQALTS